VSYFTCYQVLGLRPGASAAQVQRAYKTLAMRYHPDRAPNDPDCHRLFCQATEAYNILKDVCAARAAAMSVGACPRCERMLELFRGVNGCWWCADCLLNRRRRFLPLPCFQRIRCVVAVALQCLAGYCVMVSHVNDDWRPGAAAGFFVLASLMALAHNFLSADVIER